MSEQRIMKRHTSPLAEGPVVFNFEDVRKRCEDYKAQVREDCRKLVLDATAEAEALRTSAGKEGFEQGYQAGMRHAREEIDQNSRKLAEQLVEERLQSALPAVADLTQQFARAAQECRLEWERELIELSIAIARKVIHARLNHEPERLLDLVEEVVQMTLGRSSVELRLNPRDAESFGGRIQQTIQESARGIAIRITADDAVAAGGCVARTETGEVDARVETMLERIAAELMDGLD